MDGGLAAVIGMDGGLAPVIGADATCRCERDQPTTSPPRNPKPTATSTTPTSTAVPTPPVLLAARPRALVDDGPVVAVSVCGATSESFQIAVLRSWVNRAPSAETISCGTVRAK